MIAFMVEGPKVVAHVLQHETDLIARIIAKIGTCQSFGDVVGPRVLDEDALMVLRLLMKAERKAPRMLRFAFLLFCLLFSFFVCWINRYFC
jgi:hypothetical protein